MLPRNHPDRIQIAFDDHRLLTEVEMDLARTKKELAEVKMERDILKKAAAPT